LDEEAEREELILEAERQQAEYDRNKQDDDHGGESVNGSKPPQDRPDQQPFFEGGNDGGNSILSQLPDYIRQEFQPHVVEVLSRTPFKLAVAHSFDKQIMYAKITHIEPHGEGKRLEYATIHQQIIYEGIVINAIPIKITKYQSPITTTTTKYDILFESPTGITLLTGPATIEEILLLLRSNGHVYDSRAAERVLPAILSGYYRDNKMEIRSELETPGFYLINGKVQAYGYTPHDYEEDIVGCTRLLDDLASRYKRPEIFATLIKWGLIAPFSYVLKQMKDKTLCLPWKYDYGETHAGKTTNGEIVLRIWRIDDSDHKKGFTSVDTTPKMGFAIMHSTFPMLVNEVPDLNDPKKGDWVEAIKNAVYDETFRNRVEGSRFDHYRPFPAYRAFYFTGNPFPPDNPAFQRRMFPTYYSHDDIPAEKKEFEAILKKQGDKLGTLGDFTAKFILKNNDCLKKDWRQLTTEILIAFYKVAGREEPSWVHLLSAETQLEDIMEAQKQVFRGFLMRQVNDIHARHFNSLTGSVGQECERNVDFESRLIFCLDKELIPFLRRKSKGASDVIILHDIVTELKRQRIDYISSLPQLQSMIGGGSKHDPVRLDGSRKQHKAITVDINEFIRFIYPSASEEDLNQ
jgi:hypothetical protein